MPVAAREVAPNSRGPCGASSSRASTIAAPRADGQRREGRLEFRLRGRALREQQLERRLDQRAAVLAGDDQPSIDVTELDLAGDGLHRVDEAQARVRDQGRAGRRELESGVHDRGRRRFEEVAAHRGVDQRTDPLARDAAALERELARRRSDRTRPRAARKKRRSRMPVISSSRPTCKRKAR